MISSELRRMVEVCQGRRSGRYLLLGEEDDDDEFEEIRQSNIELNLRVS